MTTVMWARFLLMLQLTKNFGPMLRIIISMLGQVTKFLIIWAVVLVCLSSVASLLFGSLVEYGSFIKVFYIIFDTSLGSYDFTVFDNLTVYNKRIGELFITVSVMINNIVLLNFVIAILADTYSKLAEQKLGIYYDGIISRIPIYEDDKRYGGLIVGTPPFNILSLLMIPFYMLVTDEKRLISVNDKFTKVMFAPIAVILTCIFMAMNLLLLPFAYLAAIYKKFQLLVNKPKNQPRFLTSESLTPTANTASLTDLVSFILLGLPLLLMAQLRDAVQFLFLEFREDVNEFGFGFSKEHIMTEGQFEILEQFCQEEVKNHTRKTSFDDGSSVFIKTKDLILGFRKRVGIT